MFETTGHCLALMRSNPNGDVTTSVVDTTRTSNSLHRRCFTSIDCGFDWRSCVATVFGIARPVHHNQPTTILVVVVVIVVEIGVAEFHFPVHGIWNMVASFPLLDPTR